MSKVENLTKILEFSKRSKLTIVLDEHLHHLYDGLRDAGFKVQTFPQGLSDEKLGEFSEGSSILTQNTKDFISNAVKYDYDIIDIKNLRYIDTGLTRKNSTVQKIEKAVRESKYANMKGNFLLSINDDGTYSLESLY